ncbi:hypothetical protein OHA37_14730 [Streptomyces sp. NBC_00335]|uniref:protein kinase n=1 Tax=unclassified Streptomyces TaxID=2593676 RepID=UPI0022598BB4|nr:MULTISPECIES: protein kinase [unclassified Streptomyces]MCX5405137.1 hypothetical protein [Streptomyces sp. NBC_00086]
MEDYAGRILAERYRLPLPPSDAYELIETRAFDTRSGQEVLVRQVPLPEVVDAELLDGTRGGPPAAGGRRVPHAELPAVRRAIEAAQAAASVPDHPRLDQVFDVFAEGGSLWIVSELVPARPLAALIADEPLSPYRAAEVAADVLTALRVLHAHGWTHRNITMRTVLICEDGRVVLTGLAAGAAEDALCGYDPVPQRDGTGDLAGPWPGGEPGGASAFAAGGPVSGGGYGDGYGGAVGAGAVGAGGGGTGYGSRASGGPVPGPVPGPGVDAGYGQGPGPGVGADGGYGAEYGGGSADVAGWDAAAGAATAAQGGGSAPEYAPLVAPGYDTGPRYRDHISPDSASGPDAFGAGESGTPGAATASGASGASNGHGVPRATGAAATPGTPGDRPDLKAAARAGAVAAYRAGAQAAARITEQRKAAGAEPEAEPRPEGSKLPQGYSYPYGGPDTGATWHGATPRRQALPPAEPEPPARAALPAQLALPQGYQQADTQGGGAPRASGDGQNPGQPTAPGGRAQPQNGAERRAVPGPGHEPVHGQPSPGPGHAGHAGHQGHPAPASTGQPVARDGADYGRRPQLGPGSPDQAGHGQAGPQGGAGYAAASGARGPGQTGPQADRQGGAGHVTAPGAGGYGQGGPQGGAGYAGAPGADGYGHGRPQGAPGHAVVAGVEGYGQAGPQGGAGYPVVPAGGGYGASRPGGGAGGWGSGPRSGLDAERARQTRMAVVGAVTERWAPEQAQAVHGPWQLAAPVGPATDLWGLGALLYRAVQGHAPYPEDSVAELVEMVCAEPPAFAEECGPLRPVVESLLRQDPTERPDFEELRGWLRSLVRSAPEPDGGFAMLPPVVEDPARLPVVRRRADLHGRHRSAEHPRKPRSLGRSLLLGVLVLLSGAVAYALFFMPRSADPQGGQKAAGMRPPAATQSQSPGRGPGQSPSPKPSGSGQVPSPSANPPESKPAPQTNAPAPSGYTAQQDAEHFSINVPNGWERRGMNESGQVRYTEGDFVLTVVPGRDKVQGNPDPATYQKDKEPELAPYRSSTWSSVSDIKSTKVGSQLRVTGRYTWIDGNGRSVVARNFVVALGGSYHVVMVTGPQDQEGKVTEIFEQATASYRSGG